MFGLMKMLRKEHYNTDERLNLSDLYVGCTVGFGFMPQRNISGCRMAIKAVNTYMFGDDTFPAYVLDDDQNDVNLIVTKNEELNETYLSLSQRIEERLFPMLFLSHQPESWFTMKVGDRLETSERVMGMQQSWVAPSYKLAMISRGSVVEGDKRLTLETFGKTRDFDYAILVDDVNDHALEAEKYEDGTLVVYATVYRASTDIGEISPPSQSRRLHYFNNVSPKLKIEEDDEKKVADIIKITPVVAEPEVAKEMAKEESKPVEAKETAKNKEIRKEDKKETAKTEVREDVKEADTQPSARSLIALDAKLAVNVINEAQSSNISIAALIRKVIDLPAEINDQVMVDFSLTDAEYAGLTKRYKLESTDYAGVKKNIVKELQQFVGNKK